MSSPADTVPSPDPTIFTTNLVLREVGNIRESLEDQNRCTREILTQRLDGMDKAITLLQNTTDTLPALRHEAVEQLKELQGETFKVYGEKIAGQIAVVNEKITSLSSVTTQQFTSIKDTFSEKDKAVSVGLSAQKESAAATQLSNTEATKKMEDNFTKLLDQGREMLGEIRRYTELQINDLKSGQGTVAARLDKGEGHTKGIGDGWGYLVGGIGLLLAIAMFAMQFSQRMAIQ